MKEIKPRELRRKIRDRMMPYWPSVLVALWVQLAIVYLIRSTDPFDYPFFGIIKVCVAISAGVMAVVILAIPDRFSGLKHLFILSVFPILLVVMIWLQWSQ